MTGAGEYLSSISHGGEYCNSSATSTTSNATFNSTVATVITHAHSTNTFVSGVALSVVADVIIAVALGVQKLAHNRNKGPKGEPVVAYIKLPLWWAGILLNIGGEVGNMLAYGLAPAAVVAPVGSVGVVVNEFIAVTFLGEPLRKRDLFGLVMIIGGIVCVILSVPESSEELSVHNLLSTEFLFAPRAYWYLLSLGAVILFFIVFLEKRYAHEHILVWLLLCSLISSITVATCRGFASLITKVVEDCEASSCVHSVVHPPCMQTIGHWLFWVFLLLIALTAVWSAIYLNKAMMVFGNTEVVPVYYCTFTVASVIGGALIYNELESISASLAALFGSGITCAFLGVAILMSGRGAAGEKAASAPLNHDVQPQPEAGEGMDGKGMDGADGEGKEAGGGVGVGLSAKKSRVAPINEIDGVCSACQPQRGASTASSTFPIPTRPAPVLARQDAGTTFWELEAVDKVAALSRASSGSCMPGGLGGASSLVQAATTSLVQADPQAALKHVKHANYPMSLKAAGRLVLRRRKNAFLELVESHIEDMEERSLRVAVSRP